MAISEAEDEEVQEGAVAMAETVEAGAEVEGAVVVAAPNKATNLMRNPRRKTFST